METKLTEYTFVDTYYTEYFLVETNCTNYELVDTNGPVHFILDQKLQNIKLLTHIVQYIFFWTEPVQ